MSEKLLKVLDGFSVFINSLTNSTTQKCGYLNIKIKMKVYNCQTNSVLFSYAENLK